VHGLGDGDLTGRWRFIEGLGEDMLGYIFRARNAVGCRRRATRVRTTPDRFGCGHSDDGEAAAEAAGDLLNDALLALLPAPTRFEQVQVGRYVWSDGTLHRDPTGTGRHGCDATNAVFTPAPDAEQSVCGCCRGRQRVRAGRRQVYLVRDSPLGPGRRSLRFLDVNGQPRRAEHADARHQARQAAAHLGRRVPRYHGAHDAPAALTPARSSDAARSSRYKSARCARPGQYWTGGQINC